MTHHILYTGSKLGDALIEELSPTMRLSHLPALTISHLDLGAHRALRAMLDGEAPCALVLYSRHAVASLASADLPHEAVKHVFCVGAKTARAVLDTFASLHPEQVSHPSREDENFQGLVEHIRNHSVIAQGAIQGVIALGLEGQPRPLDEELRGLVPRIQLVDAYRSAPTPRFAEALARCCEEEEASRPDVIAFASPRAVEVAAHTLLHLPSPPHCAAIGPSTRDALLASGLAVLHTASVARLRALIVESHEALSRHLGESF